MSQNSGLILIWATFYVLPNSSNQVVDDFSIMLLSMYYCLQCNLSSNILCVYLFSYPMTYGL